MTELSSDTNGSESHESIAPTGTNDQNSPKKPAEKTAYDTENCGEDWSHPSGIELHLQNMTITVNMGTRLNLQSIVLASRNCEYNPKRFAACIMRLRNPKCTALIFASGKMIVTGCRTYEAAVLGSRSIVRILRKVGFRKAEVINPIPQNMVVTCDMGFPIRLEGLVCEHSAFATYEPELFPGLIYRLEHPKVVLMIFVSGKIVLTGGKTLVSIQRAFELMYPVLYQFRKVSTLSDLSKEIKTTKRGRTKNGEGSIKNQNKQEAEKNRPRNKHLPKKPAFEGSDDSEYCDHLDKSHRSKISQENESIFGDRESPNQTNPKQDKRKRAKIDKKK